MNVATSYSLAHIRLSSKPGLAIGARLRRNVFLSSSNVGPIFWPFPFGNANMCKSTIVVGSYIMDGTLVGDNVGKQSPHLL